jgi:hypothetical protein
MIDLSMLVLVVFAFLGFSRRVSFFLFFFFFFFFFQEAVNLQSRLSERSAVTVDEFSTAMNLRAER